MKISSTSRKNQKRFFENYLDRKGVPTELREEHAKNFTLYITEGIITKDLFQWPIFLYFFREQRHKFNYFTKERFGWENAFKKKEEYNF